MISKSRKEIDNWTTDVGENFIGEFQLISTEGFGEERVTVKVPGSDCYREVQ